MLIAVRCALAVFVSRHDIVNHLISSLLQDCQVFFSFFDRSPPAPRPFPVKNCGEVAHAVAYYPGCKPADHSATIHSYVEEWIRVPTQWISHGLQVRAVVLDQDSQSADANLDQSSNANEAPPSPLMTCRILGLPSLTISLSGTHLRPPGTLIDRCHLRQKQGALPFTMMPPTLHLCGTGRGVGTRCGPTTTPGRRRLLVRIRKMLGQLTGTQSVADTKTHMSTLLILGSWVLALESHPFRPPRPAGPRPERWNLLHHQQKNDQPPARASQWRACRAVGIIIIIII